MAEVSALAPALRPFAAQIEVFGPSVPAGIGPWLVPMARVLGPMRVPMDAASGDPDGYSGIARRGPYERLLASEWLFALDEPDEFIRRAVMDEHMFLARHFRDPAGASTSVALFDAGPLQLGAPRLAQIAALVVLARRAAAAGAVFRFGVLQDPEAGLVAFELPAIRAWLGNRSWAPAALHVEQWRDQIAELAPSDVWIVGADGTRPVAVALGAHALAIDEVEGPALRVQTHRRDAVGDAVTLALPEPTAALQVLRAPFARSEVPAARATTSSPSFGRLSFDGRRLLLPNLGGGLDALYIPSSAREPPGRTKHVLLDRGHTLVAADMFARRPIALFVQDGDLVVAGSGLRLGESRLWSPSAAASLGELCRTGITIPESLVPRTATDLAQMHVFAANATAFSALIVDRTGQLWELTLGAALESRNLVAATLTIRDRQCLNFTRQGPDSFGWASEMLATVVTTNPNREWELHDGDWRQCLFGATESGKPPTVAYPRGDEVLVHRDGLDVLPRPSGRMFGVLWRYDSRSQPLPHLLFVDTDDRTIRWRCRTGDETLMVALAPIEDIRYEPAARKLHFRTTAGHRSVFSIDRKAVVWNAMPSLPGATP